MGKTFSMSGAKAPSVKAKVGSGIPGDSSRARINEASGQKVTTAQGSPIGASKPQAAGSVSVASGDNMVMPVDSPGAKSTRTVTKGGTL